MLYRYRYGFSLLELLVVMALIALLSSSLLPRFSGIQSKGKEMAFIQYGRQLQLSLLSYTLEFGHYPTQSTLDAAQLYSLLKENKFIKSIPNNPYTGNAFSSSDKVGLVTYLGQHDGQSYELRLDTKLGHTLEILTP